MVCELLQLQDDLRMQEKKMICEERPENEV